MKWRYQHPELEIEDMEYTNIICNSTVEGVEEDGGGIYDGEI